MSRHSSSPALVLRLRQFGESNREAFFITPQDGIVRAAVYGGPKSKLRAYVAPFQTGTLYLYRDGVRESNKVTDFDVVNWRPGIREGLERSLTAAAIAEAVLATGGGGSEPLAAYNLANESLDALHEAAPEACDRILVYFLWHWLDILGLRPESIHILAREGGTDAAGCGHGAQRREDIFVEDKNVKLKNPQGCGFLSRARDRSGIWTTALAGGQIGADSPVFSGAARKNAPTRGIYNESDGALNGNTLRQLSGLRSLEPAALEACLPDTAETGRIKRRLAALLMAATGKRLRGCGEFAL
jgi:hypothetical protein